jgi:hypothetical protein
MSGSAVRTGCRQSIPSSSIDSCAAVSETLPFYACGQMKRPRSKRFAIRHNPPSRPEELHLEPLTEPYVHSRFIRLVSSNEGYRLPPLCWVHPDVSVDPERRG